MTSYLRMPNVKQGTHNDPRLSHARKHLDFLDAQAYLSFGLLKAQTTQTHLKVFTGMAHDLPFSFETVNESVVGHYQTKISIGKKVEVTKYQLYASSTTDSDLNASISQMVNQLQPYPYYVKQEQKDKSLLWKLSQIETSDIQLMKALRFNVFQLNQSGGLDQRISIAAKGISGDGYEGHYFWDTETYLLPYFILTQPNKAKNLLLYRYQHLDEARMEAKNLGTIRGAKIPWRTINGKESSPYYPAGSAQIHINSDVALAFINYYRATLDLEFMFQYGIELLLETAVFLLDYGHFKNGTFHLDSVTGPDEYTAIVNDNYYTNRMAKEHLGFTATFVLNHYDQLKPLLNRLGYDILTVHSLKAAADHMCLLVDDSANIIKQDANFMDKAELELESISKNDFPLLLHFHPLFIYRHQVLKQADAVLAIVLLGEQNPQLYRNTFDYYLKRTTHDSSLSKCIYGIAAYRLGLDDLAYQYFQEVAQLDLLDFKKHTRHGLHVANLGGSYLMLAYGLFGIRIEDTLRIDPALQHQIAQAKTTFMYHGIELSIELMDQRITLVSSSPIDVMIYDELVHVNKVTTFEVKQIDYKEKGERK